MRATESTYREDLRFHFNRWEALVDKGKAEDSHEGMEGASHGVPARSIWGDRAGTPEGHRGGGGLGMSEKSGLGEASEVDVVMDVVPALPAAPGDDGKKWREGTGGTLAECARARTEDLPHAGLRGDSEQPDAVCLLNISYSYCIQAG